MQANELISEIELAFFNLARAERCLRQFLLTDRYGMSGKITDQQWRQAARERVDSRWQDIPDSEIEECDCLLAHMPAPEFQYYLPAYMRYAVKRASSFNFSILFPAMQAMFNDLMHSKRLKTTGVSMWALNISIASLGNRSTPLGGVCC